MVQVKFTRYIGTDQCISVQFYLIGIVSRLYVQREYRLTITQGCLNFICTVLSRIQRPAHDTAVSCQEGIIGSRNGIKIQFVFRIILCRELYCHHTIRTHIARERKRRPVIGRKFGFHLQFPVHHQLRPVVCQNPVSARFMQSVKPLRIAGSYHRHFRLHIDVISR